ncbi:TPA: hypothetical protein UOR20_003963 [Escherichia coli]|nr:hypothetical protein [Escherichia coli]
MTDNNKTVGDESLSALNIINTIERTSKEELDVLLSIDKKLDNNTSPAANRVTSRPAIDRDEKRRQEKSVKPKAESQRPNVKSDDETGLKIKRSRPRRADVPTQPAKKQSRPLQTEKDSASTSKSSPAPSVVANRQVTPRAHEEQQRKRGDDGRFTGSAAKIQEKQEQNRHEELIEEEEKSRSVIQKITGFFAERSTKDVEGTAVDAAGVAAGGSFWKAGKEAWELVQNTGEMLGIGKEKDENKKPLLGKLKGLFSRPRSPETHSDSQPEYQPAPAKRNNAPAILRASPSSGTTRGFGLKQARIARAPAGSLDVVNRNIQKATITKTEEQTQAIKEGDQQIIERLDELLEKSGGGQKKGGLSGLLGGLLGLLGGKIGKGLMGLFGRMGMGLAGIGGLWVAKYGKKLLTGFLSLLGLKKLKSLLGGGRNSEGGIDVDIDSDDRRDGKTKDKKKKGKKPGPGKAKRTKGPGRLKKFFSNPVTKAVATSAATTAATSAAVSAIDNADDLPDEKRGVEKKSDADADKKTTKSDTPEKKAPQKSAAETAKESAEKAQKAGPKTGDKVSIGRPLTAEEAAAKKAEKTVAQKTAKKAGETALIKGTAKVGAKIGLRAVPILGQIGGVAYDVVDGYTDEQAQREAFSVADGDEVSQRQKLTYTAANVLDLGGLASGASSLLGDGARWLGMDSVADALTYDTGEVARRIDGTINKVSDAFSYMTGKGNGKGSDINAQVQDITSAIKDGTEKTVTTIELSTQTLVDTITESGINAAGSTAGNRSESSGQTNAKSVAVAGAGVGGHVAGLTSVDETLMTPDLNVGGKQAKVRAYRNNNFGNIGFAHQAGAVIEKKNAYGEQRFARWNTPEEGLRGTANQVMLYKTGKSNSGKRETIDEIMDVFAPPSENNTEAYKRSLEAQLGVGRHDKVDWSDPEKMRNLVKALARVEGGGNIQMTDADIAKALGSYNFQTNRWEGQFTDQTLEKVNATRDEKGLVRLNATDQFSIGGAMTGRGDIAKATHVDPTIKQQPTEVKPESETQSEQPQPAAPAAPVQTQTKQKTEPSQAANNEVKPADTTTPTETAITAASNSNTGENYTPGKLPLEDIPVVGDAIKKFGSDTVANAEGLRHQGAPVTSPTQQGERSPVSSSPTAVKTEKKPPEDATAAQTVVNTIEESKATEAPKQAETPQSAEKNKEIEDEKAQSDLFAPNSMNGETYKAADLPFKDVPIVGDLIKKYGGDRVANAEGLRHQSAPEFNSIDRANEALANWKNDQNTPTPVASQESTQAETTAAQIEQATTQDKPAPVSNSDTVTSAPAAVAKAEAEAEAAQPTTAISTANYSQSKSMYSVTDLQSATPAMPAANNGQQKAKPTTADTDIKILGALNRIAGLLEDIKKEGTNNDTPRFTSVKNSPQPAPRSTIPLTVADPIMSNLANR